MTNRTHLVSLAAIAALSLFNGAARADEGGGPYEMPAALVTDSGARYENDAPVTCADAQRDAWFLRQLQLSEGNSDPVVEPVACQSTSDLIASAPSQDE